MLAALHTRMFACTATTPTARTATALPPFGTRRGTGAPLKTFPQNGHNHPRTAPLASLGRRGATAVARVFSPDKAESSVPFPGNDGNDLTRALVSAESIVRTKHKAERQRAALRTARATQGVARAESLRVGIEHRCTHSLMDALPVDALLGADTTACEPGGMDTVIAQLALQCDEGLATRFGVPTIGTSSESDLDRAVLFALANRMDALSGAILLSGNFKHRHAHVLSSLMLNDETYVQRFAVRSPAVTSTCTSSGDKQTTRTVCLLTATFVLDERLAPCFKSASLVRQWALRGVTGEFVDDEEGEEVQGSA